MRETQQLLVDLGFMDRSGLTGVVDAQTSTAVLGFEKWAGLPRDGVLSRGDDRGDLALDAPGAGTARARPPDRDAAPDGRSRSSSRTGRVERVVHISSGAVRRRRRRGSFHVFRKERYSWSVPFKVWLPWASYFVGGVAFHEFGSVPTYAASHGCIRVNHYDAPILFDVRAVRDAGRRAVGDGSMNLRGAIAALAGGVGLVVGVVGVAAVGAAALIALGVPADGRADDAPPAAAPPPPAKVGQACRARRRAEPRRSRAPGGCRPRA